MTSYDVMYYFQHRLLPKCFFEDKAQFMMIVLKKQDLLYRVARDMYEKSIGDSFPYEESDFKTKVLYYDDDTELTAVKISFPFPEREPLCFCALLIFDRNFEKQGFFTVECGSVPEESEPFLCSWTADQTHTLHCNCVLDDKVLLMDSLKLYLK